jgi:spermidine synthase
VIIGDARLQLQKAADASFDILLIDAFSSDAIPVHLLTAEAVDLYLGKLKKDGLLLFHLSNRYLDLHRVLQGLPLPDGHALYYASKAGVAGPVEPGSTIVGVFSHSQVAILARESILPEEITTTPRWRRLEHDPEIRPWTDDYSNIFKVARFLKRAPER